MPKPVRLKRATSAFLVLLPAAALLALALVRPVTAQGTAAAAPSPNASSAPVRNALTVQATTPQKSEWPPAASLPGRKR